MPYPPIYALSLKFESWEDKEIVQVEFMHTTVACWAPSLFGDGFCSFQFLAPWSHLGYCSFPVMILQLFCWFCGLPTRLFLFKPELIEATKEPQLVCSRARHSLPMIDSKTVAFHQVSDPQHLGITDSIRRSHPFPFSKNISPTSPRDTGELKFQV